MKTASNPTMQSATEAKATASKGDRPMFFGLDLSWWNNAMLASLALAALAALAVTVSTRVVIILQDQELQSFAASFQEAGPKIAQLTTQSDQLR